MSAMRAVDRNGRMANMAARCWTACRARATHAGRVRSRAWELDLRHDDRGARQAALAQIGEGLVGPLERVRRDVRPDRGPRREGEELVAVGAREVRDGAQDALVPARGSR
jgi:hypothetical protein